LGADEVLDYQGKEGQGQGRVFDIDQIWMRYWMSRLFIG